jgi:hypothetical protein
MIQKEDDLTLDYGTDEERQVATNLLKALHKLNEEIDNCYRLGIRVEFTPFESKRGMSADLTRTTTIQPLWDQLSTRVKS